MKKMVSFFSILIVLVVGSVATLAMATPTAAAPAAATPTLVPTPTLVAPVLIDEFSGTKLDPKKWVVIHGNPKVTGGKLILTSGPTSTVEIHSVQKFGYGVLQMLITSSDWKPQSASTNVDSSFGFEIWQGTCHYGVVLKENGILGLLRPQPVSGTCSGDPLYQDYEKITNWDAIRAGKIVLLTLTWAPKSVTLHVSSGPVVDGIAYYLGTAEPINLLTIRLNVDAGGATYVVDYVRAVGIPWK